MIAMKSNQMINLLNITEKEENSISLKNYLLENAAYFAANTALLCGNGTAAAQIMKSKVGR